MLPAGNLQKQEFADHRDYKVGGGIIPPNALDSDRTLRANFCIEFRVVRETLKRTKRAAPPDAEVLHRQAAAPHEVFLRSVITPFGG